MITVKTFISGVQPAVPNGLWLKPIEGGFAAYVIDRGVIRPLQLVEDKGTKDTKDDVVKDFIGSVQDEKTANTINGAKAYARDLKNLITGSTSDSPSDLTLYGLKALIEEKAVGSIKACNTKHKKKE